MMGVCIAARVVVVERWQSEPAMRFAPFVWGKMTAKTAMMQTMFEAAQMLP